MNLWKNTLAGGLLLATFGLADTAHSFMGIGGVPGISLDLGDGRTRDWNNKCLKKWEPHLAMLKREDWQSIKRKG